MADIPKTTGKIIHGYVGFNSYMYPPKMDPTADVAKRRKPEENPPLKETVIIPWPRIADILHL
jgi:hypothetical protein